MNYFRNQKLLLWSVIILVIMNLITLSSFWIFGKRMNHPPHRNHSNECSQNFLSHELKFSKEQENKFILSEKSFFPKLEKLYGNIHKEKVLLSEKLFESKYDTLFVDSLIKNIANNHAEIEKVLFNHFKEINNFCDKKQQEKLKMILKNMLRFFEPGGGMRPQGNEKNQCDADEKSDCKHF
jgi:hypothetical protein